MPLWQIVATGVVSGLVCWVSRRTLLQLPELMKVAEEEEDPDQALRIVTLGCLGTIGMLPVFVVSGSLFVLSLMALASLIFGPWW